MPFEVSHPAIDLPVYDQSTMIATAPDLKDRAHLERITNGGTAATFVRAAYIALFSKEKSQHCLTEVLKRTDEELEAVAELCEAKVVPHQWGLYPINPLSIDQRAYVPRPFTRRSINLPDEHILVAEVELVKNAVRRLPHTVFERIKEGIERYEERHKAGYLLRDMKAQQFVLNRSAELCLVDIEPQLSVVS